jgi:hypothetical protein
MTINRTNNRWEFEGNGTATEFPVDERITDASHLVVHLIDSDGTATLQSYPSNYTIDDIGERDGATVVFGAAPADGYTVLIRRIVPENQEARIRNLTRFSGEVHEDALDHIAQMVQQVSAKADRAVRAPFTDAVIAELPTVASRASKYLFFDASGNPIGAEGAPSDPLTVRTQIGTASADQSVINTTYAYTPGASHLALYINGERQFLGTDYTETDSDTVTLTVPMLEGDKFLIEIGQVRDITLLRPVARREYQVMTQDATVVTLTQNTYTPNNNELLLFLNGSLLVSGVDYIETNSTTITLVTAAQEGDVVNAIIGQGFDVGNQSVSAEFPVSARENAAGITPSDLTYPWGNVFRYGCVNDGVTVDTTSFDQALAAHPGEFHVPYTGTKYIIGKLVVPASAKLNIDPGVLLQDSGALVSTDSLLNLTSGNIEVNAFGATLTMNNNYASASSSRHGVLISSGSVVLRGLSVSGCDADGVHIRGSGARVFLDRVQSTGNRRDNFRIVSGRGLVLQDCVATAAAGVDTQAGFAIVPEGVAGDYLEVRLVRPRTRSNTKAGILVSLEYWNSTTRAIDIIIDDPQSSQDGTTTGSANDRPGGIVLRRANGSPSSVRGTVQVWRPVIGESGYAGLVVQDWDYAGPRVDIFSPVVRNPNQLDSGTLLIGSAVVLYAGADVTLTPGNVYVHDPAVLDYDGNLVANACYSYYVESTGTWLYGAVNNPSTNSANALLADSTAISTGFRIRYAVPPRVQLTSTPRAITAAENGTVFHNTSQTAAREVDLPSCDVQMVEAQVEYEFEVNAAFNVTIDPNGTQQIRPGSGGAGYALQSSTVGSRVRLRAGATGYWHIVQQTGTWSSVP